MYSDKTQKILDSKEIAVGDRVMISSKGKTYEGLLMPRAGTSDILVIKMDNGYNIGLKADSIGKSLGETPGIVKEEASLEEGGIHRHLKVEHDPSKPTIAILSTGGTIASKVEYRTGAVHPQFSPEEIIKMVPEIADKANIRGRLIMSRWSEDMNSSDYKILAEEIFKEIKEGADGIVITHGTDTLHYTAAALSFALENLPIPVVLVGSQRSSDRGSSDGPFNLICAANFIVNSDFAGVAVCMHRDSDDSMCRIISGVSARKMHTSKRSAFRSINKLGLANSPPHGQVHMTKNGYEKRDKAREAVLRSNFESYVTIVKTHPGMSAGSFEASIKDMKGIVIEGTGLGHAPGNIISSVGKFIENGGVVVMTSQCINGRVDMEVYDRGRDLLEAGVVPGEDMTSETALIKLSWLLANHPDNVKQMMAQNLRGEISERSVL